MRCLRPARPLAWTLCAALILTAGFSIAVTQGAGGAAPDEGAVRISADRLEYVGDDQYLIAIGNVNIAHDGETLQADFVQVNRKTQELHARGRVLLTRKDGTQWAGDRLSYNLTQGAVDIGGFQLKSGPFLVTAEGYETVAADHFRVVRPVITPCKEEDREEFQIVARRADIRERRYVTLHHAVLWVGPIPLFYSPWLWRDLQSDRRLNSRPGFGSSLGTFLLTSYHTPLNERGTLTTASHVNLYSKRGVGLGQDLTWNDRETGSRGGLEAFYIRDSRPYRDAREEQERRDILDKPDRYRLRFRHSAALTDQDRIWLDLGTLSDPWVTKDFFRSEYRQFPRPDNRMTVTRRGEGFVASLTLQPRWDNFHETVTRLPEVRLDSAPTELGQSGIFHESRSSAARLERMYARNDAREDYAAFRIDSWHLIQAPLRLGGFLNLTPRAAYRATYYSDTLSEALTRTTVTPVTNEFGGVEWAERQERYRRREDARLRNVYELGFESSFKAFKVLDEGISAWGDGLRHVAEPYLRHTYRPEPNVPSEELYFFDSADAVREHHDIRVGMRNKLQTRSRASEEGLASRPADRSLRDLVDADVFTTVRLETDPGQGNAGPTGFDIRLRPLPIWQLDLEGRYDWDESRLDEFNTRFTLRSRNGHSAGVEYRFRAERRNQVALNTSLFANARWSVRTDHRFDLEESRLEEQSLLLSRRFECIRVGLGFRHEPGLRPGESDDFRVWLDFQVLTLPSSGINFGG